MRTDVLARMTAALALSVACPSQGNPQDLPNRPSSAGGRSLQVIELRLAGHGDSSQTERELARDTVHQILASSGIENTWRDCDPERSACAKPEEPGPLPVSVYLLPHTRQDDPAVCGITTRDARTGNPMVMIFLPPHRNLLPVLRNLTGQLMMMRAGHLIGLSLAHEVGHVLRVPHAPSGLMSVRPGVTELLALRDSRLTFNSRERAVIERTLRRPQEVTKKSEVERF